MKLSVSLTLSAAAVAVAFPPHSGSIRHSSMAVKVSDGATQKLPLPTHLPARANAVIPNVTTDAGYHYDNIVTTTPVLPHDDSCLGAPGSPSYYTEPTVTLAAPEFTGLTTPPKSFLPIIPPVPTDLSTSLYHEPSLLAPEPTTIATSTRVFDAIPVTN